ncbi:MAG: DUF1460 domain-containing protein [Dysgonomonas mossii]|uniref:N-acetylmuramoyl-L-alanine amidase-like domain-containing protein n=1 Tax=Dysgonomonas mossii TaxID=163665 RepID=UPI001D902A28|nr:N-acetylmuramoyl-L-alanine amidase-like domain-containing protein [Dysgonomonas mossii]MBS5796638.1 DUF1460 domain-containing protein [Dysgonomonas mossii]MBS7110068.1 DUF1460 domain-containing protein [Dysgonomonas mossii]
MKFYRFFAFSLLIILPFQMKGENGVIYQKEDSLTFVRYIEQFKPQKDLPFNQLLVKTAKFFLGKPYVASTLEASDNETLIINLRELDCTTFVENCIALTRVIKSGDSSFENYCSCLINMRYRGGEIKGYTSRLHYTSDWIYENERNNLLRNISTDIGGKIVNHPLSFMSGHPQLYKHLKDNEANISKMKEIERAVHNRDNYRVIPVEFISKNKEKIESGDIVVFATSLQGLDYSHIGIAYWQNGELHFIHASSKQKQVVIEKKTLVEYCADSKSCSGISILRINN